MSGKYFYISKKDFLSLSDKQREDLYDLLKDEKWITIDDTLSLVGKYFPDKDVYLNITEDHPVHNISIDTPEVFNKKVSKEDKIDGPIIYLNSNKNPKSIIMHELGHVNDFFDENSKFNQHRKRDNFFRRLIRDKKLRQLQMDYEVSAWDWANIDEDNKIRQHGLNSYRRHLNV